MLKTRVITAVVLLACMPMMSIYPVLAQKYGHDGFCAAALLIAAAIVALRYWRGGVALRATASDQAAAYSMGINVPRVFSLAWTVAAMIACVAGIVVGSIGGISSAMGVFGLSVLVVVIFGGLDSVPGALVGGLVVGVIESLAGFYLGGEYRLLATFSLLVVILLVRPYGLFGNIDLGSQTYVGYDFLLVGLAAVVGLAQEVVQGGASALALDEAMF